MRIVANGWYRTRGGHKVGPMRPINQGSWKWTDGVTRWTKLGEWSTVMDRHRLDIVAPWIIDTPPGPIRTETVTTRRIEPGVYGPLKIVTEISVPNCNNPDKAPERLIDAELSHTGLNASDWRELARVALELAEFLDAQ